MGSKKFHLIASGVLGVLFWILGGFLYPVFTQKMWQPFGIALYFLCFVVFVGLGLIILASLRDDIVFWSESKKIGKYDELKLSALLLAVFFVASLGLEFIYELGGDISKEKPTSYVFLIDDSGSMSGNDPDNVRATAISSIMEKEAANFPYAVYSFTDQHMLLKEISYYSKSDRYEFASNGGTNIVGSLYNVVNEIVNSASPLYGNAPKILLLSDGQSGSLGVENVIKNCNDNGIAVSAISFGGFFENALLRRIAYKTGGEFLKVSNADDLKEGMQQAITASFKRNLISDRYVPAYDGLYLAMRILFLAFLGAIWSIIKANISFVREKKSYVKILKCSLIFCTTAAVGVEMLYKFGLLSQQLIHLLLCVLWALTPADVFVRAKGVAKTSVDDFKGVSIVLDGKQNQKGAGDEEQDKYDMKISK